MGNRATAWLLLAGAAAGIPLGFALSQSAPQMRAETILRQRVAEIPLPANLEVRDDRWEPGAATGAHDHPGPVVLVVVEGELLEETATGSNVLRAGQAYWRPARERHNVRNAGAQPARLFAIHFDPAQ